MAVAELRSLPVLPCYYCLLWRSHMWNAMRWCEHYPDLPSGFERSSGLSASTCVAHTQLSTETAQPRSRAGLAAHPAATISTWHVNGSDAPCRSVSSNTALSLPQNQKPARSQPNIYACCCLSTQGSSDSCVSLFFLKYLLLFDVQAFIYHNNEESSVWGRKAQFKVFLGESIRMPTASTVEDDCRSTTIFLLIFSLEVAKGKLNEWFPCSSNICKSCVNEAIFDKILVSLKLK